MEMNYLWCHDHVLQFDQIIKREVAKGNVLTGMCPFREWDERGRGWVYQEEEMSKPEGVGKPEGRVSIQDSG